MAGRAPRLDGRLPFACISDWKRGLGDHAVLIMAVALSSRAGTRSAGRSGARIHLAPPSGLAARLELPRRASAEPEPLPTPPGRECPWSPPRPCPRARVRRLPALGRRWPRRRYRRRGWRWGERRWHTFRPGGGAGRQSGACSRSYPVDRCTPRRGRRGAARVPACRPMTSVPSMTLPAWAGSSSMNPSSHDGSYSRRPFRYRGRVGGRVPSTGSLPTSQRPDLSTEGIVALDLRAMPRAAPLWRLELRRRLFGRQRRDRTGNLVITDTLRKPTADVNIRSIDPRLTTVRERQ
jgi:hypothetical protein